MPPFAAGEKSRRSRCGKAIEAFGRPSGLIGPFEVALDASHERTDGDNHGFRYHLSTRTRLDWSNIGWRPRINGDKEAREETTSNQFRILSHGIEGDPGQIPPKDNSRVRGHPTMRAFGENLASPIRGRQDGNPANASEKRRIS